MRQPPDHFEKPGASETAAHGGDGAAPRQNGERRKAYDQTPIFRAVIGMFQMRGNELSAEERTLLRRLLSDSAPHTEFAVRQEAARNLAADPNADHDLVMLLVKDQAAVAGPLLKQSPVLTAGDLLEMIADSPPAHQEAIAARPGLPGDVSAALARTENPDVIRVLLNNAGAAIPPLAFSTLAAAARHHAQLRAPLLNRPDLPGEVREALAEHTPDAETSAAALAAKLYEAGHLRASLLIGALREGKTALFEHALAQLTGVKAADLCPLLQDPAGFPLALAARAARLDRSAFSTVFVKYCLARGVSPQMNQTDIDRAMNVFRNLPQERARAELHHMARQAAGAPRKPSQGGRLIRM